MYESDPDTKIVDFDTWHDGLISVSEEGLFLALNRSATELLGWTKAQVEGRHVHDVLCKHSIYTEHDQEDCPLVQGGDGDAQTQPTEAYWVHQNSQNIPVSFRRVYDHSENALIIFDSCDRQGFQIDELRKLAAFTDINPAPLLELDSQGLILFSNPAMTDLMLEFGFDDEGAPAILPSDLPSLVIDALSKDGLGNVESSAASEDDEEDIRYFTWQFHIVDSSQGRTILLSGLDTTSQKLLERQRQEYEQELEKEKERTRKEYLAMMVHELRSPLNAVVGYANVLKLKLKGSIAESHWALFDKIIDGGNALAAQISDTLDSTKVEAGQLVAEINDFDAVPVINKVCTDLSSTAEAKSLALVIDVADELLNIKADAQHFRQIAINLISNAIKYTARGRVTVKLRSTVDEEIGECISLAVKDTGCGIPDSQKESIFKLYQRQEGHVNSDIEGDGYGLAIVVEMVELNKGKILLDTRVGLGSTFTVLFPC